MHLLFAIVECYSWPDRSPYTSPLVFTILKFWHGWRSNLSISGLLLLLKKLEIRDTQTYIHTFTYLHHYISSWILEVLVGAKFVTPTQLIESGVNISQLYGDLFPKFMRKSRHIYGNLFPKFMRKLRHFG